MSWQLPTANLRRAAEALLAALVSPACAVCARVLDHPLSGAVCGTCWSAIHRFPVSSFAAGRSVAQACAVGPYEGVLREVIHALKYDSRRSVARPLAALMAEHGRRLLHDADLLVPVPLHRARQRERGFNQADDLARGLDLPIVQALRRVRRTRPQIELEAAQRQMNVDRAFAIARSQTGAAQGRVIVLIDDVTTTGATLEACARVLKAAGAAEVRALTAARVVTAPR